MSLSDGDAVLADLVERLDQFRPDDHGRSPSLESDAALPDHPRRSRPRRLLAAWLRRSPSAAVSRWPSCRRSPTPDPACRRGPCPAPRPEHLVHMGDVVAAVQHRGDEPQPGQVRVVEQRDPADPQRRMQQAPVAVHPDVARRGACQPGQLIDAVLPGFGDVVRLHGCVEQLRHRVLDDVAGIPAHPLGCPLKTVEDGRDRRLPAASQAVEVTTRGRASRATAS